MRKKVIGTIFVLILLLSACESKSPEEVGLDPIEDKKLEGKDKIKAKILLELKDEKFLEQGVWGDFTADGREDFLIYINNSAKEERPCFYLFTENSLDKVNIDLQYADYEWEETFTNDQGSVLVLSNKKEDFPQIKLVTVMGTNINLIDEHYPIVSFRRQENGKYQIKYVNNNSLFELQKYDPREADLLEIKEVTSNQVNIQDAYVNLDVGGLITHGGQLISIDQFRKYEHANRVLDILEENERLVFSIYKYANKQVVLNILDLNGKGFVSYIRFDTENESLSYANSLDQDNSTNQLEKDLNMEDLMARSFRGAKSNKSFPLEVARIEDKAEKINIEDLYELERLLVNYPYFAPYYWQVDNKLVTIPLYYKEDDKISYRTISYEKEEGEDPRFYVVAGNTDLAINSDERSRVKNLDPKVFYEKMEKKDREVLMESNFMEEIGQMEINLEENKTNYVFESFNLDQLEDGKYLYKSDLYKGTFIIDYKLDDKYEVYFMKYGGQEKIRIGCGKSARPPQVEIIGLENENILEMLTISSKDKDGKILNSRVYYSPNLSDIPREYKYFEPMYLKVDKGKIRGVVSKDDLEVNFDLIYNIRQNRLSIARPIGVEKET